MTASSPLHKLPVNMLGDLVSTRSLERTLQDAAISRGATPETLNVPMLEEILKREVYKRLLRNVSPLLAKKRITDVLSELANLPEDLSSAVQEFRHPVVELEEASRRFSLYFDWPETQRLRAVLGTARTESEAGRNIAPLVQEGQSLIAQMERRLQEGLVVQAQELAELKAVLTRVQPLGGREVRRLESLVGQLDGAQQQGILLPGELERARNLSFKLRKSLESSVMEGAETATVPEAQSRVQALEQEHVISKLSTIHRDFAALLRARPELEKQQEELRVRQSTGQLSEAAVDAWRETLEAARNETLAQQRAELAELSAQLAGMTQDESLNDTRVALDVARMTLEGGGLATEELRELRTVAQAVAHSPEMAGRVLAAQRELAELERGARDVAGALEELAGPLEIARSAIAAGQAYDLSPLWDALERQMSRAAAQRQDFDARADFVIAEYDEMRSLAGETIQRLGRLADALRAQRRLGPMSPEARERYAQTLTDAESLLTEAHAEYEAAQKVTATFGEAALDDLLDVFDFGGDSLDDGFDLAPANPAPSAPVADDDSDLLAPSQPAAPFQPAAPSPSSAEVQAPAPAPASPALADPFAGLMGSAPAPAQRELRLRPGATSDIWEIQNGQVVAGSRAEMAQDMARLLQQAAALGLHRLDMGDATHVWSARSVNAGEWRLARATDWDRLDDDAGQWLDTGEL